jgi:hypothetical protein
LTLFLQHRNTLVEGHRFYAERFRSATRGTMLIRKTDDCPRCAVAAG